jgi:peptidoglycan/LPS O-acetylase OafA/YrhL
MQKSFSDFLEKFRRVTSGGNYMPEIDGLRFIAIVWVAVLMHLTNIIDINIYNRQLIKSDFARSFILEGGNGVSFFFMISGFILALPFVKEKLYGANKVILKKYYLRRLTRLEPPYIAALLLAFILLVFVLKQYSFSALLPHLAASSVYMHNIIYNSASSVLGVAWSLEVEVQFYILAPFLCYIFFIKQHTARRLILLVLIILFAIYAFNHLWQMPVYIIHTACYFLSGMLLADLYCGKWKLFNHANITLWTGILIFIGIHFVFSVQSLGLFLLKLLMMNVFFYIAITNTALKKIMSIQWISIIGGMCYSIYLLHLMVMSAVSKLLYNFHIENRLFGFIIYSVCLIGAVLAVSMIFYKVVEQPCMKRDWYKKLFTKRSTSV